jgi:hypothetical protein
MGHACVQEINFLVSMEPALKVRGFVLPVTKFWALLLTILVFLLIYRLQFDFKMLVSE